MTSVGHIEIEGLDELLAKLARLGAAASEHLEAAAAAGALVIAQEAKEAAPVDTGALRRSIHVGGHPTLTPDYDAKGSRASKGDGALGGNTHTADSAEVQVGTTIPYGRRIELGFSGADSLGRVYHQPPQPYLRPAMDRKEGAAVDAVGAHLKHDLLGAAGVSE